MALDTVASWATITSGYLFLIITFGGIIRWVLQKYLKTMMEDMSEKYLVELKPNHGSSIKDAVDEIRSHVQDIKVDLARLEGRFEQHVDEK